MLFGLPRTLKAIPNVPGFRICPGIVDFHGDGFERHLAPRRGASLDMGEGLRALDAELASNGITTAVLAQYWSWEGGMRGQDFAKRLVKAVSEHRSDLKTDIRVQLRVETSMVDDFPAIAAFVREEGIETVIFNDHLPHKQLAAGTRPPALTGQALKAGRAPEAHWALLNDLHEKSREAGDALIALARELAAGGTRLGSHDDATAADRARFRAMGADIAEFPETSEALAAASAAGDPVILGAPNVVRGRSHKRNLSARDAVIAGHGTALVSDYHYPSLRLAALALEAQGHDAWPMISEAPARILGLTDRGRLEVGQRADLCVLDSQGRVVGTMVAGRWSYMTAPLVEALA